MLREEPALEAYLAEVRAAMTSAGAASERIADTERALREHVDEALSEGRDLAAVLAELDPPSAFAESREEAPPPAKTLNREGLLGAAGLVSGALLFSFGFAVIPNFKPSLVGNGSERIIILSVILALALGLAGRKSPYGKASLLLACAIVSLIVLVRAIRGA